MKLSVNTVTPFLFLVLFKANHLFAAHIQNERSLGFNPCPADAVTGHVGFCRYCCENCGRRDVKPTCGYLYEGADLCHEAGYVEPTSCDWEIECCKESDCKANPSTAQCEYKSVDAEVDQCPKNFVKRDCCESENPSICAGGDPHFKTWNGTWYSYHGQCDLVMLQDETFQNGLGLDVHIRTTIRYDYSFIESAAIRIGAEDILEVSSWGEYFVNGIASAKLPRTIAGNVFTVNHTTVSEKQHLFEILDTKSKNSKAIATISTFKDWVTVKFNIGLTHSQGLLGNFDTGALLARDGESIIDNVNDFGAEWQVQANEPMLFQTSRAPQYPKECILPSPKAADSRRRLGASIAAEAAVKACSHWDEDVKELCVFDVLASGDLETAQAGGY